MVSCVAESELSIVEVIWETRVVDKVEVGVAETELELDELEELKTGEITGIIVMIAELELSGAEGIELLVDTTGLLVDDSVHGITVVFVTTDSVVYVVCCVSGQFVTVAGHRVIVAVVVDTMIEVLDNFVELGLELIITDLDEIAALD